MNVADLSEHCGLGRQCEGKVIYKQDWENTMQFVEKRIGDERPESGVKKNVFLVQKSVFFSSQKNVFSFRNASPCLSHAPARSCTLPRAPRAPSARSRTLLHAPVHSRTLLCTFARSGTLPLLLPLPLLVKFRISDPEHGPVPQGLL